MSTDSAAYPVPLSVVMPVYNGGEHLEHSIPSVLEQTHRDFEFVILENGSTDDSVSRLRRWAQADTRIRLVEVAEPLGIAGSSNVVTRLARAPLIARMDQDDECLPRRLEASLAAWRSDEKAVLVGAMSEGIDAHGRVTRPLDRSILLSAGSRPPFQHGSILFRRDDFERVGGYRETAGNWADIDFILRIAATGRMLVVASALYRYRFNVGSMTVSSAFERAIAAERDKRATFDAMGHRFTGVRDARVAALFEREAVRFWAGERPHLLLRLRERGLLRSVDARVLAWSLAAQAWPRGLRWALAAHRRWRDRRARNKLDGRAACEWRFE